MNASFLTQSQTDLPKHLGWLSPRERRVADGLRFPKRRNDWLLGRWTAKVALLCLQAEPGSAMIDWEILADEDGAPIAWLKGKSRDIPLSLSHSNGLSFSVVGEGPARLGCDLERIEQRARNFEETWFTAAELDLLDCLPEENHSCAVSLVWSAKESVLKAIKTGLRVDTRRIEIENFDIPQGTRWAPVQARDVEKNEIFTGWWRRLEGMVYSVFSDPKTGCPIALHTPATPLGGFR